MRQRKVKGRNKTKKGGNENKGKAREAEKNNNNERRGREMREEVKKGRGGEEGDGGRYKREER